MEYHFSFNARMLVLLALGLLLALSTSFVMGMLAAQMHAKPPAATASGAPAPTNSAKIVR